MTPPKAARLRVVIRLSRRRLLIRQWAEKRLAKMVTGCKTINNNKSRSRSEQVTISNGAFGAKYRERSELVTPVKPLRGFTLIEILLYMGLVAIFVTPMTLFGWDVVLGGVKANVHQEVQENLRFATHRMQVEIRGADDMGTEEGYTFGDDLVAGGVVTFSKTGDDGYPVKFKVDGGALQIKRGMMGSWVPLTSSLVEVTELTFYDLTDSNSKNIKFILTIEHENPTGRQEWEKESTFESGAQLRQPSP